MISTTPARGSGRVDFGTPTLRIRTPLGSGRLSVRLTLISAVLFICACLLVLVALSLGSTDLSWGQTVQALAGTGEESHRRVVVEWRLPVALAALAFGALLGVGGAIVQSLTRNPLGSPDVIGFDAGAFTAVTIAMLVLGTREYWDLALAALAGGLLTAVAVYVLAYRGGVQGFRLIIVGIGLSAMLGSLNAYLITRADIDDAMTVGFWTAGSLHRVTWAGLQPALLLALVIGIATVLLAPSLRRLELGDDVATTHGTRTGRTRLCLLVVAVSTVALVTAAAGPIGFVALAAPQIARRLTRAPGVSVLAAAAMGALLLAAAHLISVAAATSYRPIPVGLITVIIGGVYLMWLVTREARRRIGPVT